MKFVSYLKNKRFDFYIRLFKVLPLRKNRIIFWSNNLKSYGCNPKYITEYLINNRIGKYKIYWAFNEETKFPAELPEEVIPVRYFSVKFLFILHTSKFIVCNARISPALMFSKRKGQVYIQTWHSSIRLKKIEGDASLPESYVKDAKKDSEDIDYLISGSRFSTDTYKRAFWYSGKILECGTPRCDLFFKTDGLYKDKVCNFYKIDKNKKIVLYAPTFRKDYKKNDYGLDYDGLLLSLKEKFGSEFVLLYRFHPNVTVISDNGNKENIINATKYNDIQELIAAADILVTDYSSCMFDAVIANKPCFLFAQDLDEYLKTERDLYFDIMSLPFAVAKSNEEMRKNILEYNKDSLKYKEFLEKVGSFEKGTAAEKIAEIIDNEAKK